MVASFFRSNSLSTSSDTSPAVAVAGERPPQITPIRRKSSSQPFRIPQWQLCIECKENEVMLDGIYCSKACIVKQVDAFISSNSSPSDPLPDEQKIIVVDKKRDHRITGNFLSAFVVSTEEMITVQIPEFVIPNVKILKPISRI